MQAGDDLHGLVDHPPVLHHAEVPPIQIRSLSEDDRRCPPLGFGHLLAVAGVGKRLARHAEREPLVRLAA
jgi:hypothetical protein